MNEHQALRLLANMNSRYHPAAADSKCCYAAADADIQPAAAQSDLLSSAVRGFIIEQLTFYEAPRYMPVYMPFVAVAPLVSAAAAINIKLKQQSQWQQ